MTDIARIDILVLDSNQPENTLVLPDCRVVLRYFSKNEEGHVSNAKINRQNVKTQIPYDEVELCSELVDVLIEIPRMDDPELRDTLIFSGFTINERDAARQMRKVNMQADLEQIVDFANRLGKLDILIDNARRRAQSKESKAHLRTIKRRWKKHREGGQTPSPYTA